MAQKIDIAELKEKLEEIFLADEDAYYEFVDFLAGDYDEVAAKEGGLVHIEQDGGGVGGSEDCKTIFSIGDVTYKITYNYYSHIGFETDYAQAYVVTPVQRLVTVYE
jgi:hypothetical protein